MVQFDNQYRQIKIKIVYYGPALGGKTTCLQHIQLLLARQPQLWSQDCKSFFCRYNDPPYVKMKKLEVLTEICTINNAQVIVDELG